MASKDKETYEADIVLQQRLDTNRQGPEIQSHTGTLAQEGVWDGGVDAWCSIAGGWLVLTATFGYLNSYGVFQDFYSTSGTASASLISWIGSTQVFLLSSVGLLSGKLVDLGYFRQTVFAGSLLYVFSTFMLSLASPHQYYQLFLSQGLGMGIGSGLLYVPSLTVQSHHWRSRRSMALGIVSTGSAAGGIFYPIMLNQLLSHNVGFAWTIRASAFVTLACLALANYLMRPRAKAYMPVNDPKPNIKAIFLDIPYMVLVVSSFLSLTGAFYPYFYIQVYARTHGVDDTVGFYTLAILSASSIPGRILPNMFADGFGVFNMLLLCQLGCTAIIFALFGIRTVAGIVIFAILAGFFSGAILSLLSIATALFARNRGEVGLRMGIAYSLSVCGAFAGIPINGALLGDQLSWSKTILFSGITLAAGTALLAIPRGILTRRRGTQYV